MRAKNISYKNTNYGNKRHTYCSYLKSCLTTVLANIFSQTAYTACMFPSSKLHFLGWNNPWVDETCQHYLTKAVDFFRCYNVWNWEIFTHSHRFSKGSDSSSGGSFHFSVKSKSGMHWFCITSLCDWFTKLAPSSPQIRWKRFQL